MVIKALDSFIDDGSNLIETGTSIPSLESAAGASTVSFSTVNSFKGFLVSLAPAIGFGAPNLSILI